MLSPPAPGVKATPAGRAGIGFDRGPGRIFNRGVEPSVGSHVGLGALRGRSVTFAALFALTLTGFSVISWLKWLLAQAGAHWLALLVAPTIVLGLLVRKEAEWIPDEQVRRTWARGLVFGSILAAILSGLLIPDAPEPARARSAPATVHPQGPRSK